MFGESIPQLCLNFSFSSLGRYSLISCCFFIRCLLFIFDYSLRKLATQRLNFIIIAIYNGLHFMSRNDVDCLDWFLKHILIEMRRIFIGKLYFLWVLTKHLNVVICKETFVYKSKGNEIVSGSLNVFIFWWDDGIKNSVNKDW